MNGLTNLVTVLQIISGILIMILVLLQDTKEDGNIVTGSSNKGGTMGASRDEKLAKVTKYLGIVFIVLTVISSTLLILYRG